MKCKKNNNKSIFCFFNWNLLPIFSAPDLSEDKNFYDYSLTHRAAFKGKNTSRLWKLQFYPN